MSWLYGVAINMVGSLSINLATNLIKLGHNRNYSAAEKNGVSPSFRKSPRSWWNYPGNGNRIWLFAIILFACGNLANFASFAFAAQSLLSALGSVQFISNVLFSRFVNKEPFTLWVLLATGVIVAGCVLLVSFGSHESPVYTASELQELYANPAYIGYLCAAATICVLSYLGYRLGKRRVGALTGKPLTGPWARWLPIFYATFSGLIGTQSVLYGKSGSLLIRATASGQNQFTCWYWYTYMCLLLFIISASFWMTRFNKALRLFPVSVMMPLLQVGWVLFSMISGSVYYQELDDMSTLQLSMFGTGAAILIGGVWLLTTSTAQKQQLGSGAVETSDSIAYLQDEPLHEEQDHGMKLEAGRSSEEESENEEESMQVVVHRRKSTVGGAVSRRITAVLHAVQDTVVPDLQAAARQLVGSGDSGVPALPLFCVPVAVVDEHRAAGSAPGGATRRHTVQVVATPVRQHQSPSALVGEQVPLRGPSPRGGGRVSRAVTAPAPSDWEVQAASRRESLRSRQARRNGSNPSQ